jgi:hypothetical protein
LKKKRGRSKKRRPAKLLCYYESKRLRTLVDPNWQDFLIWWRPHASRADESALRVQKAIKVAATKQTTWALFQLEREIARAQEEEDFILIALRTALDHD